MHQEASRGARAGLGAALLTALVFAVALNLRPALTSVGPVLPRLGADLALNEGMQGLLGAIPVCRAAGTGRVLHAAAH